jgi:tetratricopeptide (TPR) repeat protein
MISTISVTDKNAAATGSTYRLSSTAAGYHPILPRFTHVVKPNDQGEGSNSGPGHRGCTLNEGTHPLFQALRAWLGRRKALRELRSVENHGSHDFQKFFREQIDQARQAFRQGNREEAIDIWRKMRVRFPFLSATSTEAIELALDLGCYDEAEALLQEGQRRYPGYEAVLISRGLARVAYLRGDLEEAIRRSKVMIRKFPAAPAGYHLATDILSSLGRHDEADAIMARGASKLPANIGIMVRHANRAMRRQAWPEALRRWELMRGQFENIAVPLGIARCLREMNRLAEAEKVLTEAGAHHKPNDELFGELANLATAKRDFDAAIRCWQEAIKQNPFFAGAYTKGAAAMRKVGREAEADHLLRAAITMCKTDLAVHLEYARNAHRQRDWAAAKERWATVRDRFPECVEAREQEAEAQAALGSSD